MTKSYLEKAKEFIKERKEKYNARITFGDIKLIDDFAYWLDWQEDKKECEHGILLNQRCLVCENKKEKIEKLNVEFHSPDRARHDVINDIINKINEVIKVLNEK